MELQVIKCTMCGARVEMNSIRDVARCQSCGNEFIVKMGEKLGKLDELVANKISNLRKQQSAAVEANDIKGLSRSSSSILEMITEDYLSTYYFAYAANVQGKNKYLTDFFYNSDIPCTASDIASVMLHINEYSDLRDRAMIERYIMSLEDIDNLEILRAYKRAYNHKKIQEEHYDDIPREVFVCHRSTDNTVAMSVVKSLEEDSNKCWISSRNLRPNDSDNYWDNIENAISSCKIFLVICSEDAMQSKDVKSELNIAKRLNKPTLEYKIDNAEHTSLFNTFFDGKKWIIGDKSDNKQLANACVRVYQEIDSIGKSSSFNKSNEMQEIKDLLRNQSIASTVIGSGSINTTNLLKKANLELEDKNFKGALRTLEEVSNVDIECAKMWWLKFMCEYGISSETYFLKAAKNFRPNPNYIKALRFASEEECAYWAGLIDQSYENLVAKKSEEKERSKLTLEAETRAAAKRAKNAKIIALVSVIVIIIATVVGVLIAKFAPLNDVTENNVRYKLKDGEYVVQSVGDSIASITIPSEIRGVNVTSIGRQAFYDKRDLLSVVLPEGLLNIGDNAFYKCTSLTDIVIPDSVISIGEYAFNQCTELTIVDTGDGLINLSDGLFFRCYSLQSIKMGSNLKTIENRVFYGCDSLASIKIPNNVTSIGVSAFYGCTSLKSIVIPDGVETISENIFTNCSSLESVEIGASVTKIDRKAFYECAKLFSIELPAGVTSIGRSAFYGCEDLPVIYISKKVEEIGEYAFQGCSKLTIHAEKIHNEWSGEWNFSNVPVLEWSNDNR